MPLLTLLMHDKAFLRVLPDRNSEFTEILSFTDIAGRHRRFSVMPGAKWSEAHEQELPSQIRPMEGLDRF